MSRFEIDGRGAAVIERCLPAGNADAPLVAWIEAGKTKFGNRRDQIVAVEHGEIEKLARYFYTDRVQSDIFRPSATKSIPIESGDRIAAAAFQFSAKNVRGHVKELS